MQWLKASKREACSGPTWIARISRLLSVTHKSDFRARLLCIEYLTLGVCSAAWVN